MDEQLLAKIRRIENRFVVVLMAIVPVVQTVIGELGITFGVAFGGVLELICFYAFRKAAEKILDSTRRDKALLMGIAFVSKLVVLGTGIAVLALYLPLSVFSLIGGVSLLFVAIAIETFIPLKR